MSCPGIALRLVSGFLLITDVVILIIVVFLVCSPQGKYILTPCPISYAEEQLLHFFGQLLGIAIRADVPLPLDLLGSFWKGLVGESLDPEQDLQEADVLTYNYVKKFENVRDQRCKCNLCTC